MNGALASLARRRAISVLPTPVGPIIRMFLGTISWRRGSATCWRRQRLRRATATERLARSWPTICLSSSETISPGVIFVADMNGTCVSEGFNDVVLVGVDTQIACDLQRFFDDVGGRHVGIVQERQCSGLRISTTRANGSQAVFRLQYITVTGQYQSVFVIGDNQHGFQTAQYAIGAPVACQFNGCAHQVALVFFQFGFKAFLQCEGIGGGTGESGKHFLVVETA